MASDVHPYNDEGKEDASLALLCRHRQRCTLHIHEANRFDSYYIHTKASQAKKLDILDNQHHSPFFLAILSMNYGDGEEQEAKGWTESHHELD